MPLDQVNRVLQDIYRNAVEDDRRRQEALEQESRERAARRAQEEERDRARASQAIRDMDDFAAREKARISNATANADVTAEQKNPWQEAASGVKDPKTNHEGQSCSYFTAPLVRNDGGGLNRYANGAMSCYGERMYKCDGGFWKSLGRCDFYQGWETVKAEDIERNTIGRNIHSDDTGSGRGATARGSQAVKQAAVASEGGQLPAGKRKGGTASMPSPPPKKEPKDGSSVQTAGTAARTAQPTMPDSPGTHDACLSMQRTSSDPYGKNQRFTNQCNQVFTIFIQMNTGEVIRRPISARGAFTYECPPETCSGVSSWSYSTRVGQ